MTDSTPCPHDDVEFGRDAWRCNQCGHVEISPYRLEDGLFEGTLYEASDTLAWSMARMLVGLGVGRWRRRLRRLRGKIRS